MFIELHMIQNFVPSNLNRDDTNNPKDCEFGGQRRARISSQSLKRAIRYQPIFKKTTGAELGERTRWMSHLLATPLIEAGKDKEAAQTVADAVAAAYYSKKEKMDSKNAHRTTVLVYLSPGEVKALTPFILENWEAVAAAATTEKSDKIIAKLVDPLVKETKERTSAPDIALFGRMLADKTELNIDAACQVSHAISTHRATMEMDYYTAVDDLVAQGQILTDEGDEEAGAGMVGFTSFNSACFYRYARLDWAQLVKNLGGDGALARRTVEGFLRAAIDAIPSGKQNSFAAQNPTSLAMAVVREDGQSWNLANAFEKAVYPRRNSGLIEPSIEALDRFWGNLSRARDDAEFKAVAVYTDQYQDALDTLQPYRQPNLSGWIKAVNDALPQE
ncbi:MAG: type I-E CRISPR-associated protein Cas7/Cse4/CasC [Anaerolineae bacterium]|nr:type I-E CRISPR-associated protein Cas7/Cse4/CasC [Anaerolineae bacterium]